MDAVWSARNTATGARVALKIVAPEHASLEHIRARLVQEARIGSMVNHRHVVRVFDLLYERGAAIVVMEYLESESLGDYCRRVGALDAKTAVRIVGPVLRALSVLHGLGILHRDLKHSNIFLAIEPDGSVVPKLIDFGVAKHGDVKLTAAGDILGTPQYVAPERIRGYRDTDGRSDLFSMAVVLYEVTKGANPFAPADASPTAALAAILEQEATAHPRIPPPVWQVLRRALAKEARAASKMSTTSLLPCSRRRAWRAARQPFSSRTWSEPQPLGRGLRGGCFTAPSRPPRCARPRDLRPAARRLRNTTPRHRRPPSLSPCPSGGGPRLESSRVWLESRWLQRSPLRRSAAGSGAIARWAHRLPRPQPHDWQASPTPRPSCLPPLLLPGRLPTPRVRAIRSLASGARTESFRAPRRPSRRLQPPGAPTVVHPRARFPTGPAPQRDRRPRPPGSQGRARPRVLTPPFRHLRALRRHAGRVRSPSSSAARSSCAPAIRLFVEHGASAAHHSSWAIGPLGGFHASLI